MFFYVPQAENVRKNDLKVHIVLMNQENGIIFVVKIISMYILYKICFLCSLIITIIKILIIFM